MRKITVTFVLLLTILTARAAAPINLWPQAAPGESGVRNTEHDTTKPGGGLVNGKTVIRLGDVSIPTIQIFRPSRWKNTGATVVVCPGGGYAILAMDLEGTEICDWLNSAGVTAVLLKYRVPPHPGVERYAAPLQDAQRALRLVRFHAAEWKLDPHRLGIMGFSAGGHLSALASTAFDRHTYDPVDAADRLSCRPDFAMLIYPAFLLHQEGPDLAAEFTVTSNTPPTLLIQAEDDPIRVENSLFYYLALKQAKVPAEMHLFATGGHGYGLRGSGKAVLTWPKRAEEWMNSMGCLKSKTP